MAVEARLSRTALFRAIATAPAAATDIARCGVGRRWWVPVPVAAAARAGWWGWVVVVLRHARGCVREFCAPQ